MECLATTLKILKESSKEAVETLEKFGSFKNYLHIKRNIENDLLDIIKKTYNQTGPKLILVCGSVGDGKSHIMSYLKNNFSEFMDSFSYHNDATESNDPYKTAIETLNETLINFSDDKLNEISNKTKLIMAINLGTLNNFLESEYGKNFKKLKEYIEQNKILKTNLDFPEYTSDYFYHVNFSDYHLYQLTSEGVNSEFLFSLINKIVQDNLDNIFNNSYKKNCKECDIANKCPVKYNYEFLKKEQFQKKIINILIEIMVKYKVVISVRDLLNFFYDILVDSSIENSKKIKLNDEDIVNSLIENLIFENNKNNKILNNLKFLDPLIEINQERDMEIISLGLNLKELKEEQHEHLIRFLFDNFSSNLKYNVTFIKYKIRYNFFREEKTNEIYRNYLTDLYLLNSKKNPKEIYKKLTRSIYEWNGGSFDKKSFVIFPGKKQMKYKITEELLIKPLPPEENDNPLNILDKFNQSLILNYRLFNQEKIEFEIDYFLYEVFEKIKKGYLLNISDRNNFIRFENSLKLLAKFGKGHEKLEIYDQINNFSFKITKDDFDDGWCFSL